MRLSMRNVVWLGSLSLGLIGCGGSDAPGPATDSASGGAAGVVEEAPDLDTLLASADIKRGQTLYFQCRACHTIEKAGANKVGPNLWGMFGSKAGQVAGFTYSDALKNSGVVWTPETVDQWLKQPADFLPGNLMVFIGVKDPQDRASMIAYLQAETTRELD